jgi:peptidyl-prolyl cis-trans isomerase C
MQQLESGEDFGHLAMFNSECPSKAQGGDLGWFGKGEPYTHT